MQLTWPMREDLPTTPSCAPCHSPQVIVQLCQFLLITSGDRALCAPASQKIFTTSVSFWPSNMDGTGIFVHCHVVLAQKHQKRIGIIGVENAADLQLIQSGIVDFDGLGDVSVEFFSDITQGAALEHHFTADPGGGRMYVHRPR